MKKCLVIHSSFNHLGGAEILSLRMMKSLIQTGHTIHLLHVGDNMNFTSINNWSDLSLDLEHIEELNYFGKRFVNLLFFNKKASLLRYSIALRLANKRKHTYDRVISTYGELPLDKLGDRGFQFIHAPIYGIEENQLEFLGFKSSSFFKKNLRKLYVLLCRTVANWSVEKVQNHKALANSKWSAIQVKNLYPHIKIIHSYIGANTNRIFLNESLDEWWMKRDNTIVVLGRVARGKNIELAFKFLELINKKGLDLKLVVIGNPESADYGKELDSYISSKKNITWFKGLSRDELESVISSCKWGLHCAKYEHYGLSAIELQRLGCITFVPDYCGQTEIVEYGLLKYVDLDDLVNKFIKVYSNENNELQIANSSRVKLISDHTVEKHDMRIAEIFSKG